MFTNLQTWPYCWDYSLLLSALHSAHFKRNINLNPVNCVLCWNNIFQTSGFLWYMCNCYMHWSHYAGRQTSRVRMLLVFQLKKDEEYKMLVCVHTALKLIYICHSFLGNKIHVHQFIYNFSHIQATFSRIFSSLLIQWYIQVP